MNKSLSQGKITALSLSLILLIGCVKKIKSEQLKLAEMERKKAETAHKIVAKDGEFVAYGNGVVYDGNSGLEWFVAQKDMDVDWHDAKNSIENLSIDGGGWRMPTVSELKTLYKKDKGTHNTTLLLKTTGFVVWSDKPGKLFHFQLGKDYDYDRKYPIGQIYAVRPRKKTRK